MHRAGGKRQQCVEFLAGHRPQAVRGNAQHGVIQAVQRLGTALQQRGETVHVVDQAALRRVGRGTAEIGMRVEHRQQGQADATALRGGGDALGHLGAVGVRGAIGGMVQVVELAHAGEAGFEHFHVGLLGDGLHRFGLQVRQEAVHQLAPAPEAVTALPADLGQPGHAPLESVTVQVAQPRQRDGQRGVARLGGHAGTHLGQAAAGAHNAHIAGPALRQQCVGGMENKGRGGGGWHHWTSRKWRLYCIDI